jgi:hypothetical protein
VWTSPAGEQQRANPILPQSTPPAQPQPANWHEQPPAWDAQPQTQGEQPQGWGTPPPGQGGLPQGQQPGWGDPHRDQQWGQLPAGALSPAYPQMGQAPQEARPKRGLGIFAAIAAVLAAVIAVAALVFVLANRAGDKDDSNVPTVAGDPPTDVQLTDQGSRISLTWTDPTNGTVSFIVAFAHPGEQLAPSSTLGPGKTSYEVTGLNANLDYCFAVVAVYRDNKFATSRQVCTDRAAAPSATK